jgi:molybdopterin adenylyltransferase
MKVARVTLSDRASSGVYEDRSGPAIEEFLSAHLQDELEWVRLLIPDERAEIEKVLRGLCDEERCDLVLTTGGTGPSPRDVTPEATRAAIEREFPGFGEIMRVGTFPIVNTSILSRALAGTRGKTLILNLPGNPQAVGECLPLVLPAICEAVFHLTGKRPITRQNPSSAC